MIADDLEQGRTLLAAGRWPEARAAFEAALRLEETGDALEGLAEALMWEGDVRESIACHQRAFSAFREQGGLIPAAFAALGAAILYKCFLGNVAAAHGWVAKAETAAHAGDATPVQGWLWSFKGYLAMDHDLREAEELQQLALDHARLAGDQDLELIGLSMEGVILAKEGRLEEALRSVDEAMAGLSAGEYNRLPTVITVLCGMLMTCEIAADLERAREWCRVADEFHERYGCAFLYAECRAIYGSVLLATGRWQEAETELQSALDFAGDLYTAVSIIARAYLADLRVMQGRPENAENLLLGLEHETQAALALARCRLEQRQPQAAIPLLERVLRQNDPGGISAVRAMEMLVAALLEMSTPSLNGAGERPVKAEKAAAVLDRLQRVACSKSWPEAQARAACAAGKLAVYQHDDEAAAALFEKSVSGFGRIGMPFEAAVARLQLAEASCHSSPGLAIEEAERALDIFLELGAQSFANAAAALLRRLGIATRPGPRGLGLLTLREREILALLRNGLSNPEIAERLVISRKTVAHHVSNLLSKLDVRNRAEAAAYAAFDGERSVR